MRRVRLWATAITFHVTPEGDERPVSIESGTLMRSEINYAPGEREALDLICKLKKSTTDFRRDVNTSDDFRARQANSNCSGCQAAEVGFDFLCLSLQAEIPER